MSSFSVVAAIICMTGACSAGPAVVSVNPLVESLAVPVQQLQPEPYEFGYEFGNGLGMTQYRREIADGTGSVKGSYGYVDPLGVLRLVDYTAGSDGYKAVIRSNEPGLSAGNSANAVYLVQPPPPAVIAQGLTPTLEKFAI